MLNRRCSLLKSVVSIACLRYTLGSDDQSFKDENRLCQRSLVVLGSECLVGVRKEGRREEEGYSKRQEGCWGA
ncbi:hypothetical protein NA56DRAFT_37540 [Hyaloscypha hepaticicola]|uniref:Secreted protein n=1 Tax=Hyaloscypha hepaticicola TaxID=2082293 RepID=A0A2J6PDL2_9HELO|nr:hypothetical protein NA56DRAFT_37540 [Hyaloscypha hepaticicola]